MDVVAWLRGLGLERYAPAFCENDVDGEVLPELTSEDLISIGVASVGHRRRLLASIASLGDEMPAALTTISRDATAHADAERRQLTVMFCDLVGSTALSSRLDPEDLSGVIAAYNKTASEVIRAHDGFVAEYMGDGVLAYFGYPCAHEDDAESAVQAGLELVDAIPRIEAHVAAQLHCRVGIATGLVVVDLLGSGEAQKRGALGDTPNLAARLQGLAKPNMVIIDPATRRLVGALYEYRDLGAVEVKGLVQSVPAWQVLGPSIVTSRFEALRGSTLSPLIGRDEEMDLLLRRWSKAKTGEGHVVLLSGEAGIGKSRLTAELLERLTTETHTRLRYFCSPHRADSAFHPIIGQMERAAGLACHDKPQAKLDKLDSVLAQTSTSPEDGALFAEMLSLPNDGHPFIGQLERAAGFARDDTIVSKLDKLEALLGDGAESGDISLIAEMLSLSGGERFPPLDLSP